MNISALTSSLSTYQVSNRNDVSASESTTSTAGLAQDGPAELSELGTLMQELSDLQTSDPTKFKEVASEIASKLQDAADSATADGDTELASALSEMASQFTTASEDGTMPELRPAGPPPPPPADESESSSDSSTTSSSSDTATLTTSDVEELSNLLALFTQNMIGTDPYDTLTSVMDSVLSA